MSARREAIGLKAKPSLSPGESAAPRRRAGLTEQVREPGIASSRRE
jgi:hypothetical protein